MSIPANSQISTAATNIATLKELYNDDAYVMKNYVYNKNPGFALLPKDESESGLAGKSFPIPAMVMNGAGRSADFGTAQTNQSAPSTVEFQVTRVRNYSLATISGDFLRASAENIGAFMPAAELNTKSAFSAISNDMAHDMFRDGSGLRGSFGLGSGTISTGVITLDNASDAMFFSINMALVSYSVSGLTPTQSTSTALGYVIAVNVGAGQITVAATMGGVAATPTNWSTSFPNLAQAGDVNFVSNGLASANMLKLAGMGAWVPAADPSGADNFFTVNRSVAIQQLSGLRFDGTGESIQDALIDAANQLDSLATDVGSPDMIFVNPVSYQTLVKQLTSQGQYQMIKAKINEEASISFKALVLPTATGEIAILQDRNVQPQTAWITRLDTWKLKTLGKAPQFLTMPGMYEEIGFPLFGQGIDAVQLQIGYYGNMTCNAPVATCRVALAQ